MQVLRNPRQVSSNRNMATNWAANQTGPTLTIPNVRLLFFINSQMPWLEIGYEC